MQFNRFDIAAAYYHFTQLTLYRGMPYDYQEITQYHLLKAFQLRAMRYRPGLSESHLRTLSPNAKAIYKCLVHKKLGVYRTKTEA
ncbi:hypothetical protein [Phormidesmis sp. 146-33]